MNCPSCQQELEWTQLACPRCGYLPGFDAEEPTRSVSPWADPEATWHEVSPAVAAEPAAGATPEPVAVVPEPTLAFGSPQQYLAAVGAQPTVPPVWGPPVQPGQQPSAWGTPVPPPKRRLLLPILLLSFALLVAGGGVAAAGYFLGWFGSGTRPADMMPASTSVYVQVDLNPSLAQKAQAWEFFRDLPEVKKAVASGRPDPKRMIWDFLSSDLGTLGANVNYDADVKPWLGDRVGYGIVPNGDKTSWVTAIEVTNETAGATQLRKWMRENDRTYDVTTRNGYALVTEIADTAFVLGELEKGSLAKNNEHFTSDVRALGDTGLMAAWVDAGAQKFIGSSGNLKVRAAYALRFSADAMTFDGKLFGLAGSGTSVPGELGNLPATTGAAISISGGGASLKLLWPSFGAETSALKEYGLEQADIEALLGRNFSLSMPTSSASEMFSSDRALGLRVVSDDVTRAERALRTISASSGTTIRTKVDGDVLSAATTTTYLDELSSSTSRLSSSADFTKAVPDHAKATAAFYVNLAPLLDTAGMGTANEYSEFVKALRAVGGEYVDEGSGNGSWSIRVVRS